jgi:hypothetical protein
MGNASTTSQSVGESYGKIKATHVRAVLGAYPILPEPERYLHDLPLLPELSSDMAFAPQSEPEPDPDPESPAYEATADARSALLHGQGLAYPLPALTPHASEQCRAYIDRVRSTSGTDCERVDLWPIVGLALHKRHYPMLVFISHTYAWDIFHVRNDGLHNVVTEVVRVENTQAAIPNGALYTWLVNHTPFRDRQAMTLIQACKHSVAMGRLVLEQELIVGGVCNPTVLWMQHNCALKPDSTPTSDEHWMNLTWAVLHANEHRGTAIVLSPHRISPLKNDKVSLLFSSAADHKLFGRIVRSAGRAQCNMMVAHDLTACFRTLHTTADGIQEAKPIVSAIREKMDVCEIILSNVCQFLEACVDHDLTIVGLAADIHNTMHHAMHSLRTSCERWASDLGRNGWPAMEEKTVWVHERLWRMGHHFSSNQRMCGIIPVVMAGNESAARWLLHKGLGQVQVEWFNVYGPIFDKTPNMYLDYVAWLHFLKNKGPVTSDNVHEWIEEGRTYVRTTRKDVETKSWQDSGIFMFDQQANRGAETDSTNETPSPAAAALDIERVAAAMHDVVVAGRADAAPSQNEEDEETCADVDVVSDDDGDLFSDLNLNA